MIKFQTESIFIVSIYPGKLKPILKHHGLEPTLFRHDGTPTPRTTIYELVPVPAGAPPHIIEVHDGFERTIDLDLKPSANPVDCRAIAHSLVNTWAAGIPNLPEGARRGIAISDVSNPSQEFLDNLRVAQNAYFEWFYNQASFLAKNNHADMVTDEMKLAAKYLDREEVWSNPNLIQTLVPCPACGEKIISTAVKCRFCSTILRALPEDLARLNPGSKPGIIPKLPGGSPHKPEAA
jgi:hypothetical protein